MEKGNYEKERRRGNGEEEPTGAKIALITDEVTGKVYGYKQTDINEYDVLADAAAAKIINRASLDGKDVYYLDGELTVRERDGEEYSNKLTALCFELSQVQRAIERGTSAFSSAEAFSAAAARERELKEQISDCENAHDGALYAYKTAELKTHEFKYYCGICLIIRDENEYLREWLEWHVGQGAEHFYIYDHGSKQPVSEFAKTLDARLREKITVREFCGEHKFAQHDAYNDCIKRYGKECRWIGFIDADEMIRVKCGMTLPELLRRYEDFAGLFMRWVEYDANGLIKKDGRPLRERFTRITPTDRDDGIGKSFVQALCMQYMETHNGYPYPHFDVVDENRSAVDLAQIRKTDCTDELVCVDHYYTKSYEEWLEKLRRGTCDPVYSRKYADFFVYNPDMEYCREDIAVEQRYEVSEK